MNNLIMIQLLNKENSKFKAFCQVSSELWQKPSVEKERERSKLLMDKGGVKSFIMRQMWTSQISDFSTEHLPSISVQLNSCYLAKANPINTIVMSQCQNDFLQQYPEKRQYFEPLFSAGCSLYDLQEVLKNYQKSKASNVSTYSSE